MDEANVLSSKDFNDANVNKVTQVKTDLIGADTYFFKPGQVLDYHRHPEGDQVFFVFEGEGTFYLDDGTEQTTKLTAGSIVLAPKNVWHKIVATTDLVASQSTSQPAGMEVRD